MKVHSLKSNHQQGPMQILQNNIQMRLYDLIRITHQFIKTSHDFLFFIWLLDAELKYKKYKLANFYIFINSLLGQYVQGTKS